MNKFYMNGKLIHKASDHNTKRCEVEKWVFLPHSDFERLKANPYQEHEAITAARDLMYEDKNAYHCIMLLDEYGEDGLLIEAEGFDYPRLSMFVPDAKSIYERYQTSESELKLHDMIKDTVKKIAELAHTDKTDFTSADMIDMDEVESLVKNAIVQQLAHRDDIKMAKNTDIGVDFQPDIHVEAEKLAELKFYCPLKVQRDIKPLFDEDGEDEFFEDTEELSDFEVLEYESEISSAIEAYQSDEEENRGIMAYLGDRKRFADVPQAKTIYEQYRATHLNELRFCCPIEIYQHIKDYPKDNCILDNTDMVGYADDINAFIYENDLPAEHERGLMHWYHPEGPDDEIAEKVQSAHCTVEVINGELTGVITAKIIGELSDESMAKFTDYCVGQLSDGWGESLEQKYMRTENGEINISFWSDDEAWALVPEDEYLSDNTQDMEMSM